jgi:hypothetical protein
MCSIRYPAFLLPSSEGTDFLADSVDLAVLLLLLLTTMDREYRYHQYIYVA